MGSLSVMAYSVSRSMRLTAKPQLWAMSLALEAQGETVPKRGATMIWTVLAVWMTVLPARRRSIGIATLNLKPRLAAFQWQPNAQTVR